MGFNRREFLGLLMASSQFADARSVKDRQSILFHEDDRKGFSILQGLTDETSTQFTIVTPTKDDLMFSVAVKTGTGRPVIYRQEKVTRPFSGNCVHRLQVNGLRLGSTYTLTIEGDGAGILDQREFKALDLSKRAVKLGLISCALDHLSRDSMWTQLESQRPDLIFFLGDNVYTDRNSLLVKSNPDEEQLWHRYVATRMRLAFYYQKQLIPVLAIWDDHDFGGDNKGSEFQYKEESLRIFETFFAQNDRPSTIKGPGIARRFSAFGADFFLMDGRYFRENAQRLDRQMFGMEQEDWLFRNVRGGATFVMNGSMFYGAYTGKDAFEGQFDSAFKRFVERTKKSSGLFCFASGDVHFSEVQELETQQLGYPSFELVSSSIHSSAFPGHQNRFKNARRRGATGSHNFIIFEGEFNDDSVNGVATSYGYNSILFRVPVTAFR